jgi:TM2 domain-containing membrane protein YozV
MQHTKVKSATVAGLLGIFLGQFGAHSWYLGKKNRASPTSVSSPSL